MVAIHEVILQNQQASSSYSLCYYDVICSRQVVLITARDGDIYRFTPCRGNPNARHTHHLRTRMATFHKITIDMSRVHPPSVHSTCNHSSVGSKGNNTPSIYSQTRASTVTNTLHKGWRDRPTLRLSSYISLPTPIRRYAFGTQLNTCSRSHNERSLTDTYGAMANKGQPCHRILHMLFPVRSPI